MTVSEAQIRNIESRLNSLEETVGILANKRLLKSIKESLDDFKAGRYTEYKDIKDLKAEIEHQK